MASMRPLNERILANPYTTGLVASAVIGSIWMINDYKQWRAFGTGGTPPNVYDSCIGSSGYCRMTLFRILFAYHIPRQTNPETLSTEGPSYLKESLPPRAGGRPKLMPRILPQRQVPEPIDPGTREQLLTLMRRLADEHPDILETKPSATEGKTTDGLYARKDNANINPLVKSETTLDHEIGHAHPTDNGLHVWLSDPDARQVIAAGWGQRFCLPMVQSGWIMVYAPRDSAELRVIEDIVKAAVRWVTNVAI
ncbi:hypothetical protein UA08_02860 [Talaromyces atroroseus]|uniref:Luciferase domain-containing protein n=1 Tax=Talaromyces atroroseus TaxID=1441469 RepID=A0A225AJZ3_TALAT|nr:hypothetical protein UA08_02860 [Talaromyces atroroseus]OKL61851.1 hypothetical protein UA08_02860 [Talaromyces atroroseus]